MYQQKTMVQGEKMGIEQFVWKVEKNKGKEKENEITNARWSRSL